MKKQKKTETRKLHILLDVIKFVVIVIIASFLINATYTKTTFKSDTRKEKIIDGITFKWVPVQNLKDSHDLVLVNTQYPDQVPSSELTLTPAKGLLPLATADIKLNEAAEKNAVLMLRAAAAAGQNNYIITSGYRSRQKQEYLYTTATDKRIVAKPGESEHETGLAIDFQVNSNGVNFGQSGQGKWMSDNGYKYGFILRFKKEKTHITGIVFEPWHFRYIGLPHSYYVFKNNWVLEEYIASLKPGNYYNEEAAGQKYLVYRTKAINNFIEVPSNTNYTVSSDGTGHYIVTGQIDKLK